MGINKFESINNKTKKGKFQMVNHAIPSQSYINTPAIYSAQPQATVFRDEKLIVAAKAAAEAALGRNISAPKTSSRPWSASPVGYGQAPQPVNINFTYYRPRPTFWELLLGQSQNVTNVTNIYNAPAPSRRETAAEQEQRKKEESADTAKKVGLLLLVPALFAVGYELVKWKEAVTNNNSAAKWETGTVGDVTQTGGSHPHVQKLNDLASRLHKLTKGDLQSRTERLAFAVSAVATGALLALGGYLVASAAITAGWILGTATVGVLLLRAGMYCASSSTEYQDNANAIIRLSDELQSVTSGQRQLYYWQANTPAPVWMDEQTVQAYEYHAHALNQYYAAQAQQPVFPQGQAYVSPYSTPIPSVSPDRLDQSILHGSYSVDN